jgi:SAM-dependent methyltransferase
VHIAQLWQYCLDFAYDREAIAGAMEQWLRRQGAASIIDVACGTGFPTIELIKRGLAITCSDGSAAMLELFRRNAEREGVAVEPRCLLWEELAQTFGPAFELVICRGNSLIYAGTWDDEAEPDRSALGTALGNFRECLRPGGSLYVDTTAGEGDGTERYAYPERRVDGRLVAVSEIIHTDKIRRIRIWHPTIRIDGVSYEFERRSHYLPPEELVELLRGAGFRDIRRHPLAGDPYAGFLAAL